MIDQSDLKISEARLGKSKGWSASESERLLASFPRKW